MLRMYIFANAVRLRHDMTVIPTMEDNIAVQLITLPIWVRLVDAYTKLDAPMTVADMVKAYTSGKITINLPKSEKTKITYDDVDIYSFDMISLSDKDEFLSLLPKDSESTDLFLRPIMSDDTVYKDASMWYLRWNKKIILRETFLISNRNFQFPMGSVPLRRAFRLSHSRKDYFGIPFYLADIAMQFAFDHLGIDECYRLMPKPKAGETMQSCIAGFEVPPEASGYKVSDLGDYLSYRWSKEDLLSQEELKKIYKVEEIRKLK